LSCMAGRSGTQNGKGEQNRCYGGSTLDVQRYTAYDHAVATVCKGFLLWRF
jgi:hypothetical protein